MSLASCQTTSQQKLELEGGPKKRSTHKTKLLFDSYANFTVLFFLSLFTVTRCTFQKVNFSQRCAFHKVHFSEGVLFIKVRKLEDLDPLSPFQRELKSSPNIQEFLQLSHFFKPCSNKGIPRLLPLTLQIQSSSSILHSTLPPPIIPLNLPPMDFFANIIDSLINLQGLLHDLPKKLERFFLRFIYGETWTTKYHIKVFKKICNQKRLQ